MTSKLLEYQVCDDWISCKIEDQPTIYAMAMALRKHSQWLEVVSGLNTIVVQFDLATIAPDQAVLQLKQMLHGHETIAISNMETIDIPICYDPSIAPDVELIAALLNLSVTELAKWHSELELSVTMLGFMPGFAYLDCDSIVPDIGRLDQPRTKVAAGSVGVIGSQHCIYSFDSPGGWPIIGRTPVKLFDSGNRQPARLTAGQKIRFVAIDIKQYHTQVVGEP